MAYNYYPYYPYTVSQPVQQQTAAQPQMQSNGLIPIPSEEDARNYPVAPGNSVTFKDEKLPYVYTKTMGFSQLDRPIFEKYKLVKEALQDTEVKSVNYASDISELRTDLDRVREEMSTLRDELNTLKDSKKTVIKKKEVVDNDT